MCQALAEMQADPPAAGAVAERAFHSDTCSGHGAAGSGRLMYTDMQADLVKRVQVQAAVGVRTPGSG